MATTLPLEGQAQAAPEAEFKESRNRVWRRFRKHRIAPIGALVLIAHGARRDLRQRDRARRSQLHRSSALERISAGAGRRGAPLGNRRERARSALALDLRRAHLADGRDRSR